MLYVFNFYWQPSPEFNYAIVGENHIFPLLKLHKSIQHLEKPLEHSDCSISTTEICNSRDPSKFLTGFWAKLVGKMCPEKVKNVECLDHMVQI
jgi:hypothetical protein